MIVQNIDLKPFNTFGLSVQAQNYLAVQTLNDLAHIDPEIPFFVLGGGSNVLFTKDFEGLLVHIQLKGIEVWEENPEEVHLKVAAGENWHNLVLFCLANNWGGLENLALIPGTVGAAPIQNIGAYGAELSDVFMYLDFYDTQSKKISKMSHADCNFGYRNSIFKHSLKSKGIITALYLRLKKMPHALKLEYGAIKEVLAAKNQLSTPSIQQVARAVIEIRQSKLPDPQKIGNCGSFFKNPEVTWAQYESLKDNYPSLVAFKTNDPNLMKLSAGWLIEQCGWKGRNLGRAGVYTHQALVLVNLGGATASEIWTLAQRVQQDVLQKFQVMIIPEVNVL